LKKRAQKKISKPAVAVELVHSTVIRQITGYDDQALRRLAGKGIIPAAKLSKWPLKETLAKLFAHRAGETAKLPVFDSMDACAGAGYFSKSFLQTMKSFGLPGFENTRVDFNKLIPAIETFFASTGESQAELQRESVTSFKEMREKYSARREKIDFELAAGDIIAKQTALETLRELLVIHHHSYGRMIEEWPSVLSGETPAKIRTHITKQVDALKSSEANSINALEKAKSRKKEMQHTHD
jgi:hypothetical protein